MLEIDIPGFGICVTSAKDGLDLLLNPKEI